jgi:hypothetical protein
MTQGCLIFAYNGDIDYGSQAVVAAALAQKNLKVPVSVVTNIATHKAMTKKFTTLPFDKIILTDAPNTKNLRKLNNGQKSATLISFANGNRSSAWELTPYDRTLIIDSDFLVLSNTLSQYWDSKESFLINPGMIDLTQIDKDPKDYLISNYSIKLLWATNIMFSKNAEAKLAFDLAIHVKENYAYYAAQYHFDPVQFRNDYAFSIACHILGGHGTAQWHGELPCPVFIRDVDDIHAITNEQITFILKDYTKPDNSLITHTKQQDVHIMNKHSIIDNLPALLTLADYNV